MSTYQIDFILNYRNKEVSYDVINNIFKKYNIDFHVDNNIELFIQGLTHESFSENIENYDKLKEEYYKKNPKMVFIKNNSYERLEFLGDAIIKPIISIYLFNRYPYEQEGFLSTLRTKIESTKSLSHFFQCLGLKDYILISQSFEQEGNRDNIHIMEDCFESFIGALYMYGTKNNDTYDKIMSIIQKLMNTLIETELNLTELIQIKDYKGELNIYCHKAKYPVPVYIKNNIQSSVVSHKGKYATNKEMYLYSISVQVNGKIYGPTSDIILKEAEQKAAKLALEYLNNQNNNDDDIFYV